MLWYILGSSSVLPTYPKHSKYYQILLAWAACWHHLPVLSTKNDLQYHLNLLTTACNTYKCKLLLWALWGRVQKCFPYQLRKGARQAPGLTLELNWQYKSGLIIPSPGTRIIMFYYLPSQRDLCWVCGSPWKLPETVMPGKLNNHCSESALSGDLMCRDEALSSAAHPGMTPPQRRRQRDLCRSSWHFHPSCGSEIIPLFKQCLDKSERSQSNDHKHLGTVCLALVWDQEQSQKHLQLTPPALSWRTACMLDSATKPLQIGVLMAENRVLLHTPSWHLAAVGITSVQYWEGSQNRSNRLAPFVTSVFSPPLPTSTGHPTGCGRAGILLHQRLSCASSPASDHRGAPGTHSKVPRSAPKQRASWDLLWSLLEVLM